MLEKAEKRSRTLDVNNTTSEINDPEKRTTTTSDVSTITEEGNDESVATALEYQQQQVILHSIHGNNYSNSKNKLQVIEKNSLAVSEQQFMTVSEQKEGAESLPTKVQRQFSVVDKENLDVDVKLNVMTYENVEVSASYKSMFMFW